MKLESLKSQVNNKKGQLIRGKIAKNPMTFRKNKPNSPNVQMNLINLTTMIYTIFASLTKVKNKPKQTQFKADSKPIIERPKMNVSNIITMNYTIFPRLPGKKTNPKQTQSKHVLSAVEWANSAIDFSTGHFDD